MADTETVSKEIEAEPLNKPDMVAVLERTYLSESVSSLLLPLHEAISNALHGIEAKFPEDPKNNGDIKIKILNLADPSKLLISVTDNGIGLNEENYKSFKTPFSGLKLKKRGRGFGRFIAFKIFSRVHYSTRYSFMGNEDTRTFRFDIAQKREIIPHDGVPDFQGDGLCVELNNPLSNWHEVIKEISRDDIVQDISGHFLPMYLQAKLPRISLQFDDDPVIEIGNTFRDQFSSVNNGEFQVDIDGHQEKIEYSITRLPKNRQFKSHCLLFSAADRIVGNPRSLSNIIGTDSFVDKDDKKYVVVAVARSELFERNLNNERTGINISPKSIEKIVGEISSEIQKGEKEQIDRLKDQQANGLNDALSENPILRLGLKGRQIREYVDNKPNSWKAENFVADLALERYRSSQNLSEAISLAVGSPEEYEKEIKEIVEKIDQSNKETLAEYVAHRRRVLELLDAARRFSSDGTRAPEDAVHDLIFRRFSDSTETSYFEHNLWVIDDTLAFIPYVSSDRTVHGGRRAKGDKVPDLIFFEDSMILGSEDESTVSIVEFKRPNHDEYSFGNEKKDPVTQVLKTFEKAIAEGGINRKDGVQVEFSNSIRRFGYVIADVTPTLRKVLRGHDFQNDSNPDVWYRYRTTEKIFIQVFGYKTLIENAKKRNQAFFKVLFGE